MTGDLKDFSDYKTQFTKTGECMTKKSASSNSAKQSINIKLTQFEYDTLNSLALAEGFRNVSEYVRVLYLNRAKEIGLIKTLLPNSAQAIPDQE